MFKNIKRKSFTVVELTIYIALFGILTFVLFNIFDDVINLKNLGNKQNETTIRYKINPVELALDFPKKVIVPSNPEKLLPTDPPVVIIPGNIQYCSFQWTQQDCTLDGTDECLVCQCQEVECNDVGGCANCHKTWVPNPEDSDNCTCTDMRGALKTKVDNQEFPIGTNYISYLYDIYNPINMYVLPLATPGVSISNPKPTIGKNYFSMHPYYQFAWNNNRGWINFEEVTFNPDLNTVHGNARFIEGGDLISFNCSDTNSCSTSNYQVKLNKNTNEFEGFAWSQNLGWISFNCNGGGAGGSNICGTSNYKVTLDPSTGSWGGYAWNPEVGWISFNCNTGGTGQTDICATSDYQVKDSRTLNGIITYEYNAKVDGVSVPVSTDYAYNTQRTWNLGVITPTQGTSGTDLTLTSITGTYFLDEPLVKLVKSGSPTVFPKSNFTFVSQDLISDGVFDLRNVKPGVYDLIVADKYGNIGKKSQAITVK